MLPGSVPIDVSQPERARAVFTPKAIVQSQATPNRSSPAPLTILDPSGDMISVTASGVTSRDRDQQNAISPARATTQGPASANSVHPRRFSSDDFEGDALIDDTPEIDEEFDTADRKASAAKPTESGETAKATLAEVVTTFNRRLRLFRLLLLVSGMHQKTHPAFRLFVRLVLWSCALLCTMNIGFRTTSYRNTLFDITLSLLHFWVIAGYEHWTIVNQVQQQKFSSRINIVGILATSIIPACATVITLGWLVPILTDMNMGLHALGSQDFGFMLVHGALMIVIILPWAAACLASCFLFYLMVSAHKADFDRLYADVHRIVRTASSPEQYFMALRKHRPVLTRLHKSSLFFQNLYVCFVVVSFLLVLSGTININILVLSEASPSYSHLCQDIFYIGLGCIGLVCGLFSVSSLSEYWSSFLFSFGSIPSQFPIAQLPYFTSLLQFFTQFPCNYTVHGLAITRRAALLMALFLAELYVAALLLFNYFGPSSKCG